MCRLYSILRSLARRWLVFAFVLIFLTFVFGLIGFARQEPKNNLLTDAYLVVLLFALSCNQVGQNVGWDLEIARWLGFVVWSLTIAAILIRLFSQPWLTFFVDVCSRFSRGHVIVAGLGQPKEERDRLVERMRGQGKNVVVVEPDPNHPGLEACRQAGAICLVGSPFEPATMKKAQLSRAAALLALCEDDRKNVALLGLAASLLGGSKRAAELEEDDPLATLRAEEVGCVVQVSEPRLLEVLRQHEWHRNAADRLHVRVFNMHEMVARVMLRECLIGLNTPALNKFLLLGIGAEGRLGEALILRAAKDRFIDAPPGQPVTPLEIHVYDQKATAWVDCMKTTMDEDLSRICQLKAFDYPADCIGFRAQGQRQKLDQAGYDAVFICMSHESPALIQAAQLRAMLPEKVRIIVRVHEETAGFGTLIQRPAAGGLGKNIRVVGTHDRVFDVAGSMNPMVEMFAQVLHQDFLLLNQHKYQEAKVRGDDAKADAILSKKSFVAWRQLADDLKESNRLLAQRLRKHMTVPNSGRRFKPQFSPHRLLNPAAMYQLAQPEVEALAMQEHAEWMIAMKALDWRKGTSNDSASSDPEQKLNPNLVPWDELDEGTKEYDRNIIRRLPYVFAKADYEVIEIR